MVGNLPCFDMILSISLKAISMDFSIADSRATAYGSAIRLGEGEGEGEGGEINNLP